MGYVNKTYVLYLTFPNFKKVHSLDAEKVFNEGVIYRFTFAEPQLKMSHFIIVCALTISFTY